MNAVLDQSRRGFAEKVRRNKSVLTIFRQPTRTNAAGKVVPDSTADPEELERVASISREQEGPYPYVQNEAGQGSNNLSRYIKFTHDVDIREGDRFTQDGRSWTVATVDPIRKFNGVSGYQAKLKENAN